MAKSWRNGTMILDAAGQGYNGRSTETYACNPDGSYVTSPAVSVQNLNQRITSIHVDPSAAAWVVVLSDQAGNVIWSADGLTKDSYPWYGSIDTSGVVLTTATNVTRVVLNADPVQW